MPLLTATALRGARNRLDRNQAYDLEGNCGLFARNIEWTIDQSTQCEGIIFQLVKRTISVERYDADEKKWVTMAGNAIDQYVGRGHETHLALWDLYWEAWKVTKGNTHPTY